MLADSTERSDSDSVHSATALLRIDSDRDRPVRQSNLINGDCGAKSTFMNACSGYGDSTCSSGVSGYVVTEVRVFNDILSMNVRSDS